MTKLSIKQEKFAIEFLKNGGDASKAYRASYSAGRMKPATVWRKASELMVNGKVAARIETLRSEINRNLEISAENALRELARIAFADPRKLFHEKGALKNVFEIHDDTAAAIASINVVTKGRGDNIQCVIRIRFWDKVAALEKIGKHLKLFTDKLEYSTDDGLTRLRREIDGKTRLPPRLTAKT